MPTHLASPRTRRGPRGSPGRRSRGLRPASRHPRPSRTISASSSPLVIATPAAVEHPRGLRAERAVHERLQVAEPQEVVAEARPQAQLGELGHALVRQRLPDAQRQPVALVDAREDRVRAEPAVLVVDRGDAACVRDRDPLTRRRHPFVLDDRDEALAERPGRLLAEDPRRRARLVALDDAARHLEVAPGPRERGAVQPEGVVVLRPERGGRVAGDLVECRRSRVLRPERVPPPGAAQPLAVPRVRSDTGERLLERLDAVQLHVVAGERPGGEVDVRVGEGGQHAAAARGRRAPGSAAPARGCRRRRRSARLRSRAPRTSAATGPSSGSRRSRGSRAPA